MIGEEPERKARVQDGLWERDLCAHSIRGRNLPHVQRMHVRGHGLSPQAMSYCVSKRHCVHQEEVRRRCGQQWAPGLAVGTDCVLICFKAQWASLVGGPTSGIGDGNIDWRRRGMPIRTDTFQQGSVM